jgi:hypothetical protein
MHLGCINTMFVMVSPSENPDSFGVDSGCVYGVILLQAPSWSL